MQILSDEKFLEIIEATPLVSIDLIVENSDGEILLGKRLNRPAKNYWFVTGGRIRKNERITDAFSRISTTEFGYEFTIDNAELLGAYNHIYDDNAFNRKGINTHYVVLAYKVKYTNDSTLLMDKQHSEIRWWGINELLNADDVHPNTKAYFIK